MKSSLLSHNPTQHACFPLIRPSTHHHTTTKLRRLPPISAVLTPRLNPHITNIISPEKIEIFKSLEPWASKSILPLIKPVDHCWQPSEFLPDPSHSYDQFSNEVQALRDRTTEIPDEYFVVLVGHMITEDALPTYQTVLNTHDGVRDETGASPSPWAVWSRAWTAEENRHGDLLRTYLYLSGRVDMLMIERTMQYLIGAGVDVGTKNNPYMMFVYTSIQERATFISHCNMARLAKARGDPVLARICRTIASDEKSHENVYSRVIEKLLEVDPTTAMLAIADMMRKSIVMPGHLMYDGRDSYLFKHLSDVVQQVGVYTVDDYVDIIEFFIGRWRLEKIEGLTSDGRCAQEFVCGLPPKIRRIGEVFKRSRADEQKVEPGGVKFSWIFNKKITL